MLRLETHGIAHSLHLCQRPARTHLCHHSPPLKARSFEMLRSPRHRSPHRHRARRAPGRARQRVAPFIAGFALCFLIFGGGDDDAVVRSELARAAAEAAAQHAAEAATAAEIAERAVRGEVRGKDPYACPCACLLRCATGRGR